MIRLSDFDCDFEDVIDELDRLAREIPEAVPKALNAMSNILVRKIRDRAPKDIKNTKGEHLKDLIGKTKTRTTRLGNKYQLVFITKRGDDDKHIYKAVVAEYGRDGRGGDGVKKNGEPSKIPNPFWRSSVLECREQMLEAGRAIMEAAVEKAKKNKG